MWENIEQVKEIIKNSNSKSEVLRKLELKNNGGNFNTLSHFILRNSINIEHFGIGQLGGKGTFIKYEIAEILVENSTYQSNHLKNRLYKEGIKKRICEKCGQNEYWNGDKMSLILDHVNGDRHDNRIQNLRILCPNCNATLETHCRGMNVKSEKYDLCNCGGKKRIDSKKCFECFKIKKIKKEIKIVKDKKETRKVKRPSYNQLLEEVNEIGYAATGRKYNVSDNSIRKWIKMYEKYGDNF
jgi:hypothetical protein